jgi:hypothetical protein
MAFRTQKISQMTPKGSDLEATDLIEVSTIESGSYVTRSITGQELIDAIPVPPSGITIGTTAITSGTVGRVLFEGTGNVVQESANLFWDETNGRLGIGTSSPSTTFAIGSGGINRVNLGLQAFEMYTPSSVRTVFLGYSSTSGQLIIASGGSNDVNFLGGGFKSISTGNFAIGSTTDAGYKLDVNGTARVSGLLTTPAGTNLGGWYLYANGTTNASMFGGSSWVLDTVSGGGYRFRTAGNTDRLRIESTGNVLINTTTDAGYRLDVNGTARVQGKLTLGNSTASPYQLNVWGGAIESYISLNNTNSGNLNTDGFQIGLESNGTDVYFINRENGFIKFRTNNLDRFSIFSTGNVAINTTTDAGFKLDVNGTARVQNTITLTGINTPNNANLPLKLGNFTLDVQTTNPNTATGSIITTGAITKTDNGVKNIINVNNAVTSTAANFNTLNGFAFTSTINQTLGTIRGIYIAPTLTASTNFRAIETTAGNVIFGGLPTSSAGLPTGAIWNDAGTLKIV